MSDLTHLDEHGRARMVDVSDKSETDRVAVAGARVVIQVHGVDARGLTRPDAQRPVGRDVHNGVGFHVLHQPPGKIGE